MGQLTGGGIGRPNRRRLPATSLRLPVKETPKTVWENQAKWAVADAFGAAPSGQKDSAEAIQKAMDSGAATVYLPSNYKCSSTKEVRRSEGHTVPDSGNRKP